MSLSPSVSVDANITDIIDFFLEANRCEDEIKNRKCIRTVMYRLMRHVDKLKIMDTEITKRIEKNCKHNWVIDSSTYDPCRSYRTCTICDASN
jgi:hypothetical protein